MKREGRAAGGLLCSSLLGGLFLIPSEASAQRPSEGGLWSFAADDELEFHEDPSARVRVHYSVAGSSVTLLEDLDEDSVPDYVERVAEVAVQSLDFYGELGFRAPVSEAALGLGPLGGSPALDIYLVDFEGNADGLFDRDLCTNVPLHCAGWIALENDFAGYSYSSIEEALATVIPHELFHAVQAAYDGGQPVWFSEGTAVWAQRMVLPSSTDFVGKCQAYLDLHERPLDKPPSGPVQAFAYGTALFWWFLHARLDGALDVSLQLVSERFDEEAVDIAAALPELLAAADDDLADAWFEFAQFNLATGARAGALAGHEFAASLAGVSAKASGPTIDHDARFSPLAASYYHLEHGGGPLAVGVDTIHEELRLSLHRVTGGAPDGPVEPALIEWRADTTSLISLGEREAGGYWVVGTLPLPGSSSAKTRLCLGPPSFVEGCFEAEGETETGSDESGDESGETGGADLDDPSLSSEQGCECGAAQDEDPTSPLALAMLFALGFWRRRPKGITSSR